MKIFFLIEIIIFICVDNIDKVIELLVVFWLDKSNFEVSIYIVKKCNLDFYIIDSFKIL